MKTAVQFSSYLPAIDEISPFAFWSYLDKSSELGCGMGTAVVEMWEEEGEGGVCWKVGWFVVVIAVVVISIKKTQTLERDMVSKHDFTVTLA